MIEDELWRLLEDFKNDFPTLTAFIKKFKVNFECEDGLILINSFFGDINVRSLYLQLFGIFHREDWFDMICGKFIPMSKSFLCWRIFYGRLWMIF